MMLEEFKQQGVLVIPNVIPAEEIAEIRSSFHKAILDEHGIDVNDLPATKDNVAKLSSTHGSGGILDMFYYDWKLRLNEDERIVSVIQSLWRATYGDMINNPAFYHPYGDFDASQGFLYVDRVCFRLPEHLVRHDGRKKSQLQRSLTPHLDCCPHDMYTGRKWRPIQAFLSLSDTLEPNQGGFEACKGHHLHFEEWTRNRQPSKGQDTAPCVGQFTPIRPKEDVDIIERMEHVPCRAGDLVCWDYRIPHANSMYNLSLHPREVIYIGLLPNIPLNQAYAIEQLSRFVNGQLPVDQWHSSSSKQPCDYHFSNLGRRLMAIDPWI